MVYEGINNGDRTTLQLPSEEQQLLIAVKAACDSALKPLTVVLTSGGGLSIDTTQADGLIQAWYCGPQGGTAIAEVLAGDVNPSGKLPITFYASDGDLPDFTDYAMSPHPALTPTATTPAFIASEGRTYPYFTGTPEYAFGFGLSYSTFNYDSNLSIENGRAALRIPKDTYLSDDPDNFVNLGVNITTPVNGRAQKLLSSMLRPVHSALRPLLSPNRS